MAKNIDEEIKKLEEKTQKLKEKKEKTEIVNSLLALLNDEKLDTKNIKKIYNITYKLVEKIGQKEVLIVLDDERKQG